MALLNARAGTGPEPDMATLPTLQRLLLTTDGTVTDLLEAWFREPMGVVKLDESLHSGTCPAPLRTSGEAVLRREILLRGKQSGCTRIHALTLIVPDRLPEAFRESLASTREPIGSLMLRDRLETFREIIHVGYVADTDIARHFDSLGDIPLICRTYLVWYRGAPMMQITESFPARFDSGQCI